MEKGCGGLYWTAAAVDPRFTIFNTVFCSYAEIAVDQPIAEAFLNQLEHLLRFLSDGRVPARRPSFTPLP
jgi:hypothetical protein